MVNNGYDSSEGLDSDPDLESLRENPRYEELVNRAKSNYEAGSAAFAHGLPEYTEAPDTLDTEEKLNEWVNQQNYILYMHRPFWSSTQHLSAQIDRTARYLTALKKLKKDDPDFDYGLERVRTSFRMKTIFESGWGVVADLILHEVKAYKQSSPSAEGLGEANYYAAVALSLKFAGSENRRVEGFKEADTYLAEIDSGTKYYGASKALKLINKYQSPDADKKELGPRIRSVIEEFPNDEEIYNAVSSRLNHEAVSLLWPIPLDLPDLDGNLVSLGEYRGKVLLMDFWATWCSPCRAELPNLIKTYKEYQPKGLEVLSISLDYPNRLTTEAYRAWIKENEMNWRHVYDGKGWDSALVKRYFIGSIPAPFLVGPDGSLVAWGENCRGEKLAANVEKALELMTD